MKKFYKKPSPEKIKETVVFNKKTYSSQLKELRFLIKTKQADNFTTNMYLALIEGRKITPKMANAMMNSISKCKNNPLYNEVVRIEQEAKLQPIMEKIVMVEKLAESKNDKALGFIQNVKEYVTNNYRVTKKQMEALNKVHKRVSEDLFKGDE